MLCDIDVVIVSSGSSPELKDITRIAVETATGSETFCPVHVFVAEEIPEARYEAAMIYPGRPFGYHRYLNEGLKLGHSEYVALCNNDVVFRRDWARWLVAGMVESGAASASPIDPLWHIRRGFHPFSGIYEGYRIGREVSGWCIMTTRTTLAKIGGLDERFLFWYADHDYANTLRKHGLKHVLVTSSWVEHLLSQTMKSMSDQKRRRLCESQLQVYRDKWGDLS